MKKLALAVSILAVALGASCSQASSADATTGNLGPAATELNQHSKARLGVSIRSLGLLFETRAGTYSLKDALISSGSWPFLQELERAGLAKISTVTGLPDGGETSSEFVAVELTPKGQQVRDALAEP